MSSQWRHLQISVKLGILFCRAKISTWNNQTPKTSYKHSSSSCSGALTALVFAYCRILPPWKEICMVLLVLFENRCNVPPFGVTTGVLQCPWPRQPHVLEVVPAQPSAGPHAAPKLPCTKCDPVGATQHASGQGTAGHFLYTLPTGLLRRGRRGPPLRLFLVQV